MLSYEWLWIVNLASADRCGDCSTFSSPGLYLTTMKTIYLIYCDDMVIVETVRSIILILSESLVICMHTMVDIQHIAPLSTSLNHSSIIHEPFSHSPIIPEALSHHSWNINPSFLNQSLIIPEPFSHHSGGRIHALPHHPWAIIPSFLNHFHIIPEAGFMHCPIIPELLSHHSWSIVPLFRIPDTCMHCPIIPKPFSHHSCRLLF